MREAARKMIAAGHGGVIINVVSTAGFKGVAPDVTSYVTSKHGVRGMVKQTALELAPHDIRLLGIPDDIARAVHFCASDMSMFMTGSTLLIDAGETI